MATEGGMEESCGCASRAVGCAIKKVFLKSVNRTIKKLLFTTISKNISNLLWLKVNNSLKLSDNKLKIPNTIVFLECRKHTFLFIKKRKL
jgi:hypothetical protein